MFVAAPLVVTDMDGSSLQPLLAAEMLINKKAI